MLGRSGRCTVYAVSFWDACARVERDAILRSHFSAADVEAY